MQLFHNYHHGQLYKALHSNFWLFDLSVWIHVFARSLVAIFIPIFLLQMGYSVKDVILYSILFNAINLPLNFLASYLTRRIGARKVIILSLLFEVGFFLVLYNINSIDWFLIFLLALFAAIYDALYWVAHVFVFMKCADANECLSKKTSFWYITQRFAGVLSPLFGALIMIFFSKHILIITSIILILVSAWPLFKTKNIPDKPEHPAPSFWAIFSDWAVLKDFLYMGLFGVHGVAENVIWPMFIFMLLSDIKSVAALPIIISLTAMVFTYFAGRIKREQRRLFISLGSFFLGAIWITRLLFDAPIYYFASVFLAGFFCIMINIPLDSNIFEKGKKYSTLNASLYRNLFSMFFRMLTYIVLYVMVELFSVSFVMAAISLFAIMLLNIFIPRRKPILIKPA